MIEVNCFNCGAPFKVYKYRLLKGHNFYCKECYPSIRKKILSSNAHLGREASIIRITAHGLSDKQRFALIFGRIRRKKKVKSNIQQKTRPKKRVRGYDSNRNSNWKGDNVSYRSLHKWVERWLGKPTICQFCNKDFLGREIHWANVSGRYLRDVSDWMRLCKKCHKKFDDLFPKTTYANS